MAPRLPFPPKFISKSPSPPITNQQDESDSSLEHSPSLSGSTSESDAPSERSTANSDYFENIEKVDIAIGHARRTVSIKILKEIKRLQRCSTCLIPQVPFAKLVHQIMQEHNFSHRINVGALNGLQYACELFMTQVFEDTNRCAEHANRITIQIPDMQLVTNLLSRYNPMFID